MRVMITGVTGQLGYDCALEAEKRGYSTFGLGKADLDITDRESVFRIVKEIDPQVIVHCAAWTNVDGAEDHKHQCRAVNVDGTRNIADAAKEVNAKLVYISTDYVFDGSGSEPWETTDEPSPINVYGQSKLDGELIIRKTLDKYFIVRSSWIYGVNGKNFVKTILRVGNNHSSVNVVDDQIGTPTFSEDLAKLIMDMVVTEHYGVYHACNSGGYISWYNFTKEIYKTVGLRTKVIPVSSEEFGAKAVRPHNSRLNLDKLKEKGFAALPEWKDALRRYLEYGADQSNL